MNTWVYDLRAETDPLIRVSIHGLWRHLTYGLDTQSDTVKWELTDTSVTLHWANVSDLDKLMSRMVGGFEDGIAVSPGYPSDRNDQTIYATVLAHKGITQNFFAKKGSARSRSEAVADKVDPSEAPWSKEGKIARLTLAFTRHKLHDDTPSMDVKKDNLDPKQKLGVVYHPMASQWNSVSVVTDPKTKFAMAFSCLAHVFTQDSESGSPFGLGVDAPTFSEADDIHNKWIDNPLFRAPNEAVCAWGIASLLDLPCGTYVQVGERGARLLSVDSNDTKVLYPILQTSMGAHAGAKTVRMLENVEIGKAHCGRDAYDQIIKNVKLGRAWYADVIPVSPYARVRTTLTNIFYREASQMEQQIALQMSKIRTALARNYAKHYGADLSKSYERADNFIINVNLNRARNRPALLKSVAAITREAGRGFTTEELSWILSHSEKRYSEVQSLLILACTTFYAKASTASDSAKEDDLLNLDNILDQGT